MFGQGNFSINGDEENRLLSNDHTDIPSPYYFSNSFWGTLSRTTIYPALEGGAAWLVGGLLYLLWDTVSISHKNAGDACGINLSELKENRFAGFASVACPDEQPDLNPNNTIAYYDPLPVDDAKWPYAWSTVLPLAAVAWSVGRHAYGFWAIRQSGKKIKQCVQTIEKKKADIAGLDFNRAALKIPNKLKDKILGKVEKKISYNAGEALRSPISLVLFEDPYVLLPYLTTVDKIEIGYLSGTDPITMLPYQAEVADVKMAAIIKNVYRADAYPRLRKQQKTTTAEIKQIENCLPSELEQHRDNILFKLGFVSLAGMINLFGILTGMHFLPFVESRFNQVWIPLACNNYIQNNYYNGTEDAWQAGYQAAQNVTDMITNTTCENYQSPSEDLSLPDGLKIDKFLVLPWILLPIGLFVVACSVYGYAQKKSYTYFADRLQLPEQLAFYRPSDLNRQNIQKNKVNPREFLLCLAVLLKQDPNLQDSGKSLLILAMQAEANHQMPAQYREPSAPSGSNSNGQAPQLISRSTQSFFQEMAKALSAKQITESDITTMASTM